MSCSGCENAIKNVLDKINGVHNSSISAALSSGNIAYDKNIVSAKKIIDAINSIGGFKASLIKENKEEKFGLNALLISISATFLIFVIHIFYDGHLKHLSLLVLASIVQFICGYKFYKLSYMSLKNKVLDMHILVALSTTIAYIYSIVSIYLPYLLPHNAQNIYLDGSSAIITFVLLGKFLENKAKNKANNFLKELVKIMPQKAHKIIGDDIKEINAQDIKANDIVIVKAGEKVPSDGIVIEGKSEVDTSSLNGEYLPSVKKAGDNILGGSINILENLHIKITKDTSKSMMQDMVNLLQIAQSKKPKIARLADKIASVFVLCIIFIAIITFVLWIGFSGDIKYAIISAITVLIVSCPCALGLATPISIVSAISKGSKEGILIKNTEVLELGDKINCAIFDKTGTITNGNLKINDAFIKNESLLKEIHTLSAQSEHPISKAIVSYCTANNIKPTTKTPKVSTKVGLGLIGEFDNTKAIISSFEYIKAQNTNIDKSAMKFIQDSLQNGFITICCSFDNDLKAVFKISDSIRASAKETLNSLKQNNIESMLLSGDHKNAIKKIANELKITKYFYEQKPQDKQNIIQDLQKKGKKIIFVGDGINDALSLKQANIGISLYNGSTLAKEAGDIIILKDSLSGITKSIKLSSLTLKNIKQNLFFAYIYNISLIPIAGGILYPFFGILISPIFASIAMGLSSITVVLNALRLNRAKL